MITWDVGDEVVITDGVFLGRRLPPTIPSIDNYLGKARGVVVQSNLHDCQVQMESGSILTVPNMALARF